MQRSVEHGTIPDGWRRVRLGDVADVAFSGVDKRTLEGELPVQLCNYTDVFYNRRIQVGMDLMGATATDSEKGKWTLRKGDVLFTKDSETPDEIGIPAYVVDDMPGVLCGYHLGLARPRKENVDGAFLAEALTSSESRKQFARIANGGDTVRADTGSHEGPPHPAPASAGAAGHRRRAGQHRRRDRGRQGGHRRHRGPARRPAPRPAHPAASPASTPSSTTSPASAPSRRTGRWCGWGKWGNGIPEELPQKAGLTIGLGVSHGSARKT